MARISGWTVLLLALVLPGALAVNLADRAAERAYFAERIRYPHHLPAPQAVEALWDALGYRPAEVRGGAPVPRRFLIGLPEDMNEIDSPEERKRLFIATLLPLVMRVNELILADRERMLALATKHEAGRHLGVLERRWLRQLARRYGLGTDLAPEDIDFALLRRRVDAVPPSLALAQGAIESGWGSSFFAREGNAIYGQWTWSEEHDGIVPRGRRDGKNHRIRAFEFLIDSVRFYMLNLNRNPVYSDLRRMRARARAAGRTPTGTELAGGLLRYSERREAYIEDVRAVIRTNRLDDFDRATLAPPRGTPPIG